MSAEISFIRASVAVTEAMIPSRDLPADRTTDTPSVAALELSSME